MANPIVWGDPAQSVDYFIIFRNTTGTKPAGAITTNPADWPALTDYLTHVADPARSYLDATGNDTHYYYIQAIGTVVGPVTGPFQTEDTPKELGPSLANMIADIQDVMEDHSGLEWTPERCVRMLNEGQDKMARKMLKDDQMHLLPELDRFEDDLVCDITGAYDLNDLTYSVFGVNRGIIEVRLKDGKKVHRMSEWEYTQLQNRSYTWTTQKPGFIARGSKIYVKPYTSSDVESGDIAADTVYYVSGYDSVTYNGSVYVDGQTFTGVDGVTSYSTSGTGSVIVATIISIRYKKEPQKMVLGATEGDDVSCEFTDNNTSILLGLSLERWRYKGKNALATWESAVQDLQDLKESAPPTDSIKDSVDWFTNTGDESDEVEIPQMAQYLT